MPNQLDDCGDVTGQHPNATCFNESSSPDLASLKSLVQTVKDHPALLVSNGRLSLSLCCCGMSLQVSHPFSLVRTQGYYICGEVKLMSVGLIYLH